MLINGAFSDSIDASDRGLAYGDGLFETIRIAKGRPILLDAHMQRLRQGCETLGIEAPIEAIEGDFHKLLSDNRMPDAVLKVIVTRGVSGRGYKSKPGGNPTGLSVSASMFPTSSRVRRVFQQWSVKPDSDSTPVLQVLNTSIVWNRLWLRVNCQTIAVRG